MPPEISLIVLPNGSGDTARLPQYLLERQGAWCDLSNRTDPVAVKMIQDKLNTDLGHLQRTLELHRDEPDAASVWNQVRVMLRNTIGNWAYSNLVPDDLRKALKDAVDAASQGAPPSIPVLRIHQHNHVEWIPWEIMHDGTDFLGLRFQIVRVPISATGPAPAPAQHHTVRKVANLLGREVLETQALFDEWEKTFAGFASPPPEKRLPVANQDTSDWPDNAILTTWLEDAPVDGARILHITCHGNASAWTLHAEAEDPWNYEINSDTVKFMVPRDAAANLLVFCNACQSTGAGQTHTDLSLASQCFELGVPIFIGTTARITGRLAVPFARKFYQCLLVDGLPAGQALIATKRHFRDLGGGDPSWLFYCLYGSPNVRFQLA